MAIPMPSIKNEVALDETEAFSTFNSCIAILSLRPNATGVVNYLKTNTKDKYGQELTLEEKYILGASTKETTHAMIGFCCLVYPYERYKKLHAIYPDKRYTPEKVFGDGFGTDVSGDGFKKAFPGSRIVTWNPNIVRTPGTDDYRTERTAWFIECVRNSFAYGQSEIIIEGEMEGLRIWNILRDAVNAEFEVVMKLEEFASLVNGMLSHAMSVVLENGSYEPLQKLLDVDW